MITCVVEYVIVPAKIDAFERFARRWIELVDSHGGMHHGYFLPAEGASDKAHVQDVSAETSCADFHKPYPRNHFHSAR